MRYYDEARILTRGLSLARTKWKMKPLSRENWLNIALKKKRQWWGKAYAVQLQTRKRVVNARYTLSARLLWNQLYVLVWSSTLSASKPNINNILDIRKLTDLEIGKADFSYIIRQSQNLIIYWHINHLINSNQINIPIQLMLFVM